MNEDLNIFGNEEKKEDEKAIEALMGFAKLPEIVYTGVKKERVDWAVKGNYKVGDVVEIISNELGHGFDIGDHVVVLSLDEHGFIYHAQSINGGITWALYDTEVKRIKKEDK